MVFNRVLSASNANHIVLAQTVFNAAGRFSNGLLSSTTYTILSAHNIFSSMDSTTPRAQLLKLRSPTGVDGFAGAFNDNDRFWDTVNETFAQ